MRLAPDILLIHAGDTAAEFVPEIPELCINVPKTSLIIMESEFSAETIRHLEENDTPYLIPCRNTDGVVERLRECTKDGKSVTEIEIILQSQNIPCMMIIIERRKKRKQNAAEYLKPGEESVGSATNRHGCQSMPADGGSRLPTQRRRQGQGRAAGTRICFGYSLLICNARVPADPHACRPAISAEKPVITQTAFKMETGVTPRRQHSETPARTGGAVTSGSGLVGIIILG